MADERLSDKTALTTPADGDLLEIIDISDTSANAAGTTKKITKLNLLGTPFAGGFTDLSDVGETTLTGSEQKVPIVKLSDDGLTRKLKFERLPTFTDLLGGNAIVKGGIAYSGTALTYRAWATAYIINGQYLDTPVSADVTQATADATNPRIDVFVVEVTAAEPPVPSIVIVTGTPAANPVKPSIDLTTQVEISFRTIAALATTDTDAVTEVIYDENLGETAEWDITDTPAGANLADNTDPAVGTVAITLPAYTSDTIEWTKASLYTYVAAEMLSFYIRITAGLTPKSAMQFKLRDNSTGFYYNFSSTILNLLDYGFVQSDTDWQLIQIPLSAFAPNTRTQTQYDEFEITFITTPIIELDWIVIQGSVVNPSNQITVKFIDGDDPLDAVYTEGNVGIKTTTPTQALDVAGNININEASAYMQDSAQALKLAKNGQANYFSTWVGEVSGNANVAATNQTAVGYGAGNTNTGVNQTAVGVVAGFENTGSSQTATGYNAGYQNTGATQTAMGVSSGYQNTGNNQTAIGEEAGNTNTGAIQTATGYRAGSINTGNNQTATGFSAGYQNIGDNQTSAGYSAGTRNNGDDSTSVGHLAGYQNIGDKQTFLGKNAGGNTATNSGGAKTFAGTDVNITTEDITIATHGFGANGTWVNVLFTQGTAALGGLVDTTIYQLYIRDANTVSGLQGARQTINTTDQLGTGHTFTPQYIYTNSTGIGYDAQPTRSNQVKLGDANVTEMMLDGIGAGIVLKSPDGTEYKLTVANGGTLVIT
tara:strand:+ start:5224 stop:7521 length:2298 start_codon:yes stop_codon:yes gene_type:complete